MPAGIPIRWNDPATWPWVFYVWGAFALAGLVKPLWHWLQRERASSWPIAHGRLESIEITKPGFSFATRSGHYVAELGYSYSVEGTSYTGRYGRDFPTEYEAEEFVCDLQNKSVAIRYNSASPSRSILLEPDIEALLQNRPPAPSRSPGPPVPVPALIKPFLSVFVALSGIGLIVSLWVHLGAVMGQRVAPEAFFWMLHMGIFVVWVPAVLVAQRLVGNVNRKDFWKVVLKGSPDWMRYMVYAFLGYAIANFLLFMVKAPNGDGGGNPPAEVWRGFSGHWMAFYSAALAILYSAMRNQNSANGE